MSLWLVWIQMIFAIPVSYTHLDVYKRQNYHLHTDAIKSYILPQSNMLKDSQWLIYAKEADLLNAALWGCTAVSYTHLLNQWNPEITATVGAMAPEEIFKYYACLLYTSNGGNRQGNLAHIPQTAQCHTAHRPGQ